MKSLLASISLFIFATLALGTGCKVDNSNLGQTMPILSRDAAVPDPVGSAGTSGSAGTVATSGAAGDRGAAGSADPTGAAGISAAAGTDGDSGAAGTTVNSSGAAGTVASSGAAGTGEAGTTASGAAGTTSAAGTSGSAGTTAAAGTSGAAGTTVPFVCSPDTCKTGCCENNKCVAGRSVDRCGSGGGACSTCGKCELCNAAGSCDVNPSSDWTIVCDRAIIATMPDFGPNWDPHSGAIGGVGPDPFCQFEMPANQVSVDTGGVTSTVIDTFTPIWGQTISPKGKTVKASDLMSSSKTWRIWIGDDDGCSVRGGCVGQEICEINQPLTAGALRSGQVTHENLAGCVSMTIKFVCQD